MRPLGRDAALRRHPRVPEPVRAGEVGEPERLDERRRPADLLVDLDHPPCAHDAEVRTAAAHPLLRLGGVGGRQQHAVARADVDQGGAADLLGELGPHRVPLEVGGRVQRQLAPAVRGGVTVDGDAGAVGPAVVHLHEHGAEVLAQARLELGRLAEQSDDPAHCAPSPSLW